MRAQLLLGSVYVRDALLDPDPMASDGYRRQLQETYVQAVNALDQYTPVDDSAMVRERVARLHAEIDTFRTTLLEVLATDPTRRADARLLLRNRIVRRLLAEVGHPVRRLSRTAVGPIRLGSLPSGSVRELTREELGTLLDAVGL